MFGQHPCRRTLRTLLAAAVVVGAGLTWQTFQLFAPVTAAPQEAAANAVLPAYRYEAWYPLPVQAGRTKPFQSACTEAVRQITGRTRFEGHDPVAVVLAWFLTGGAGAPGCTDWETHCFLLCEHQPLRRQIFAHLDDGGPVAGRYVSPADLRRSPGFDQFLETVARRRQEYRDKAHLYLSAEELRAEEVGRRLVLYDALCGRATTRLFANALAGEKYLDVREFAEVEDTTPERALERLEQRQRRAADPLPLVGLDRALGSAWFSLGELRACRRDPRRWEELLRERVAEAPVLYLAPDDLAELQEFQKQVQAGAGEQAVAVLEVKLGQRRQGHLEAFERADRQGQAERANALFYQIVRRPQDQERVQQARDRAGKQTADPVAVRQAVLAELRAIVEEADEQTLRRLRQGLELIGTRPYDQGAPEFQLLHMDYLEAHSPDVYRNSAATQPLPVRDMDRVLDAFAAVQKAYRSGDADRFGRASESLFRVLCETTDGATVRGLAQRHASPDVEAAYMRVEQAREGGSADELAESHAAFFAGVPASGVRPYPGVTTIPLELRYNRVQPFRWAWALMFGATLAFVGALLLPRSRLAYVAGFVLLAASLAAQAAGFAVRVSISGWAPVSNLYETVVFAAFMAALFALIFELIYRRRVLALAGTAVATFGLILADGLPLALDPKISPLVPVLRTNYWLTIHVLTIVCGYAAGALAWGLGNLTLALLAFGRGTPESVKTLSRLTYRALQLTVLLLAAGTFLGGWWAAEAWGRFWGWDPKEVSALVALVCYVVPLHARYIGWVRDFGLAVAAVLCFGAILLSWYVVNFVLAAGMHSYGFSAGGAPWVLWAVLLNVEWVLVASLLYLAKKEPAVRAPELV